MGGLLPIKSGGDIIFIYIKAYAIFFIVQVHDCWTIWEYKNDKKHLHAFY